MDPINYTMNVLDPLQGYMQGIQFGEGLKTTRLGQQQAQQNMDIQSQNFADQQRALQEQRAAAAQQQQQAKAMQEQLMGLRQSAIDGTLTPDALNKFALDNAKTFDEFKTAFNAVSEPRRQADTQFGIQLSTSLLRGNTEAALSMLDTRISAAENSGTDQGMQEVQKLKAIRSQAEMDPFGFATANLANLAAQGAISSDVMKSVLDASGQKEPTAASPIGKIAQDVSSGIIPKSVLDSAIAVDKAAADGGLTLPQKISEEARLRGEYSKRIEDLSAAERNFSIIETSAADNSGAGDIALVTSFMKMLDPGSVVRETEFATAANTGGLLAKLKSAVTKIEDGKFLSPEQRTDFQRLAGKYLEAANTQEQGVQSSYQAIIDNYGLNPVNVFGARAATAAAPSEAPAAAEVQPAPADATSGSIPLSFMSNESVKNAAAAAGVTPEEIWAVMPDDVRATYGR